MTIYKRDLNLIEGVFAKDDDDDDDDAEKNIFVHTDIQISGMCSLCCFGLICEALSCHRIVQEMIIRWERGRERERIVWQLNSPSCYRTLDYQISRYVQSTNIYIHITQCTNRVKVYNTHIHSAKREERIIWVRVRVCFSFLRPCARMPAPPPRGCNQNVSINSHYTEQPPHMFRTNIRSKIVITLCVYSTELCDDRMRMTRMLKELYINRGKKKKERTILLGVPSDYFW